MTHVDRREFLSWSGLAAAGLCAEGLFAPAWAQDVRGLPMTAAVPTAAGRVRGVVRFGVNQFWGVPYAAPTAGANRFMPPAKVAPWSGVRDCFQVGNRSPQDPDGPISEVFALDRQEPMGEDCLNLNVFTPALGSGNRPVMVWLHGGGFSGGSGNWLLYEGTNLARKEDVVMVSVTHRLNLFGFLYLADLGGEKWANASNAGMQDIVAALGWIKENIAAFGGDPGNVTVFGESGGGAKIATLMVMPAAKGLFHKAITMSGQQVTASGPLNATRRAEAFLDKLGKNVDPATAPVEQLVTALAAIDPILGGSVYMGPVLDMKHLTRHPFWPDAAPQSLGVPMMLGNTVMETRAFYAPDGKQLAGLDFANLAARIAPEMRIDIHPEWVVAQFRARYPDAPPLELFHRIVTAARSWRGQVEEAEARARAGAPAFVYQLDFESAKHTDDIGLSFGTTPDPTSAQQAMSDRVMDVFVRFARTGDPGWPTYDLAQRQTMIFDTGSRVESDPRRWERELFARVPYIQPGS